MKILVVLAWVLCGCLVGCSKQSVSASEKSSAPAVSTQTASVSEPAQVAKSDAAPTSKPGATKVTKIVFVGKEHACACTRKAIDGSWAALQSALGTQSLVPVEQLKIDTESAKVEPYEKQKAIMALPAIYFLDEKGVAIDLLQGEVSAAQIAPLLKK